MTLFDARLCKAARTLLDWSREDLAKASGVGISTVSEFERGDRATYEASKARMKSALEAAGVVFLTIGDIDGLGVRRR
ncbi:helix-turn-helix transcriptional regulator [Emcibacter sp. SYSU 3D8]|uniref:helix-turn-helix domain-containing protein n=1 Tax=Emcibacter sp. SYSU 3D8 TaxID=3133969 RepID=UPI0031FE7A8A